MKNKNVDADVQLFRADKQFFGRCVIFVSGSANFRGGEGVPDGVKFLKFLNYTHLHYFSAEVIH